MAWPQPEALPMPDAMPADERAMRRAMYAGWLRSAGAFAEVRAVAADWFADRGHPEEAVCRAEWTPVRCRRPDPGHWWCWAVRPAAMHWDLVAAKLRGKKHNDRPWLAFPAGWVRFTGGYRLREGFTPMHLPPGGAWVVGRDSAEGPELVTVPDAWCVSVQRRSTAHSRAIERSLGRHGWTTLFHPPGAVRGSEASPRVAAVPDLFGGLAEGAA